MMLRSLLLLINFFFLLNLKLKAKKVNKLFYAILAMSITHYHCKKQFPAMEKMDVPWRTHQPPCHPTALTLVPHTGR